MSTMTAAVVPMCKVLLSQGSTGGTPMFASKTFTQHEHAQSVVMRCNIKAKSLQLQPY